MFEHTYVNGQKEYHCPKCNKKTVHDLHFKDISINEPKFVGAQCGECGKNNRTISSENYNK